MWHGKLISKISQKVFKLRSLNLIGDEKSQLINVQPIKSEAAVTVLKKSVSCFALGLVNKFQTFVLFHFFIGDCCILKVKDTSVHICFVFRTINQLYL